MGYFRHDPSLTCATYQKSKYYCRQKSCKHNITNAGRQTKTNAPKIEAFVYLLIILAGQDCYHQRQHANALRKYSELLETSITTQNTELDHPLAEELQIFKDILFESLIQHDANTNMPLKEEELSLIKQYLQELPGYLSDSKDIEQLYRGMIKRCSPSVKLPDWKIAQSRFFLAK